MGRRRGDGVPVSFYYMLADFAIGLFAEWYWNQTTTTTTTSTNSRLESTGWDLTQGATIPSLHN